MYYKERDDFVGKLSQEQAALRTGLTPSRLVTLVKRRELKGAGFNTDLETRVVTRYFDPHVLAEFVSEMKRTGNFVKAVRLPGETVLGMMYRYKDIDANVVFPRKVLKEYLGIVDKPRSTWDGEYARRWK